MSEQLHMASSPENLLPWWVRLCRWLWRIFVFAYLLLVEIFCAGTFWILSQRLFGGSDIDKQTPVIALPPSMMNVAQWSVALQVAVVLILLAFVSWMVSQRYSTARQNDQIDTQNTADNQEHGQEQDWADYVRRMVNSKGDMVRYPLDDTCRWLGWLAQQMQARSQTVLLLKDLQADWLPARRKVYFRWSLPLIGGLLMGLLLAIIMWPVSGLSISLVVAGMVTALVMVLLVGLLMLLFSRNWGNFDKDFSWKNQKEPVHISIWIRSILGEWIGWVSLVLFAIWFKIMPLKDLPIWLALIFIFVPHNKIIGEQISQFVNMVCSYTLRFWFVRSGVLPWDAVSFFEDACERQLLQRVGNGYSFRYHQLQSYFADLDANG